MIHCLISLLIFVVRTVESGCSGSVDPSNYILGFQQQQGTPKTTSYSHVLTNSTSYNSFTCSQIINGVFLSSPSTNCSSPCLVTLTPYQDNNGSGYVDIAMLRPQDLINYPGYSVINNSSSLYCVMNKGDCGATIPLYEYYSETNSDHYVGTQPENNDTSYNRSSSPLCYLVSVPTDSASISTIANKYPKNNANCNVPRFLGQTVSTTKTSRIHWNNYDYNDTNGDGEGDCCEYDGYTCCQNDPNCNYDKRCKQLWKWVLIWIGSSIVSLAGFFLLCCIFWLCFGALCSNSNRGQRTINPYETGNIYRITVFPAPAPAYPTYTPTTVIRYMKY